MGAECWRDYLWVGGAGGDPALWRARYAGLAADDFADAWEHVDYLY